MILGQQVIPPQDFFSYIKFCLECLTIQIEPTVHSIPTLYRDYGFLRVEKYVDHWTPGRIVYPTNLGQQVSLPKPWTKIYEIDMD